MNKTHFKNEIKNGSLGRVSAELEKLLRPSVAVIQGTGSGGRSHLGGMPKLAPGTAWPKNKAGTMLAHVACIDLAETAPFDEDGFLPKSGQLNFFYDDDQMPWGFSPDNAQGWKVIYSADPSKCVATNGPDRFRRMPLMFKADITAPHPNSTRIENLELTDDELDEYFELSEKIHLERHEEVSRMLGYPDAVQEPDMELECQLVSHGIDCGDGKYLTNPRVQELMAGVSEWALLLQLDSHKASSMQWGDGGRLFFWIKKEDLKQADFSKVWCILQCM